MPRVEVYDHGGKLLFRSSNFKKITEPAYRLLTRPGEIEGMPPVMIRAARSTKPMRQEQTFLLLMLGWGIPLAVAVTTTGGYFLARMALAPIDAMAGQARILTAERLAERLPVDNPEDELGRLAMVFNEMLGRLECSFDQLRRFTADASHELRTPLTVIRSVGEVGLAEPQSPEKYREIIGQHAGRDRSPDAPGR